MNRQTQSAGSAQSSSGSNLRYAETTKRKGEALTHNNAIHGGGYAGSQAGPGTTFKRRRRNYQNMIPNGMSAADHHMKSNMMVGNNAHMATMGAQVAQQGQNSLLANQALLLAQLQSNLMSGSTFLQPAPAAVATAAAPVAATGPATLDKFAAFGQFMASSLYELNGVKALDLMAKFTVDVMNALREQKGEPSASATTSMQQPHQTLPPPPVVENHINANNSTGQSANVLNPGDDKFRTHQF